MRTTVTHGRRVPPNNRAYRIIGGEEIKRSSNDERRRTTFGNWSIRGGYLVYRANEYEIKLAGCTSAAGLTRWIAQLADKAWISAEDLGNFVRAVQSRNNLHALRGM